AFIFSGGEELVERDDRPPRIDGAFSVRSYRPRIEGLFARIERWTRIAGVSAPGLSDEFWKVPSRSHRIDWYGRTTAAIVGDGQAPSHRFEWMLELTCDTRGNYVRYSYVPEDAAGVAAGSSEDAHNGNAVYLKRVDYNNVQPLDGDDEAAVEAVLSTAAVAADHVTSMILDYGEHGRVVGGDELVDAGLEVAAGPWGLRLDPFSNHRAGFEIRTRRRCKRVLVFQNLVPGAPGPLLARSTDLLYRTDSATQLSLLRGVTVRGFRPAAAAGAF